MGKLTIQEIAKTLVEKNGLEQREANQFAADMFAIILERLQQGEQVKVKGLGTWKIIGVEARESVSVRTGERVIIDSHSKVSFTPDATMKELVNKPFSQFETVVLNEGVEFDDLKDDVTEEELAAEEESAVSPILPEESQDTKPVVSTEPAELPIEIQSVVEQPAEPGIEVQPVVKQPAAPVIETFLEEPKDIPMEQPTVDLVDSQPAEDFVDEQPADGSSWGKWLLGAMGVLALMAASAFGGYELGRSQQPLTLVDTVEITDTVFVSDLGDADDDAVSEIAEEFASSASHEGTGNLSESESSGNTSAVHPESSARADKTEEGDVDPYAQKDERIRLGAYRIVGLDHEVKVLEGQTFYSICRAHLGPGMECYVEVYNGLPRDPQIKAGQTIKIPKLKLKKRRRQ